MLLRGNIWVREGRMAATVVAALACALIALLLPALAGAETFDVNTAGDAPNTAVGAVCDTGAPAAENCSLRAAIEAANVDPSLDVIEFSGLFGGEELNDEIKPATPLPAIEEPVTLAGHPCTQNFVFAAPCVGVTAPAGAAALTVKSNAVTVENVAFGGGEAGIEVEGGHTGFVAKGDWFGLRLDTGVDASTTAGIVIGPGFDGAIIGGDESDSRNVFGHSEVGIFVDGASHTKIRGNYIGVRPDGVTPIGLQVGVRIVDAEGSPPVEAVENEVGGVLTPSEASTSACDDPCNVIVTEGGLGVDLTGEAGAEVEAASGPTTIRGNYLGLAADGIDPVLENAVGVYAAPTNPGCGAGPTDVTVGGTAPTETNYIEGGTYGIFAEGAENFRALGNSIGLAADGSAGESPLAAGIEVCAEGVTESAQISNNKMLLGPDPFGIVSEWGRAEITGNTIQGSQIGVLTAAESEGHGDMIQGNTVTEPDNYGIQITNQSNVLIGNTITNPGRSGIELEEADHNRVGGDLPGEENSIVGSGRGAIVISGTEEQRNEIAANNGFGNAEAFIQLFPQSAEEPINGGIKPPAFGTVLQSSATGTAQPDATVRIFRKASAEVGELASLLAVAKADSAGNWKATYATVPVGTPVAATQTSDGGTPQAGTSEVSAPVAATADPVEPGGGGGGSGGSSSQSGSSNPPPAAPKAPKVKITKRPAKRSKSTTAKFRFTATPAKGAKFECKFDAGKWAKCVAPKTYKRLKPRRHTFRVRAIAPGAPTSKPAKYQFTVKR